MPTPPISRDAAQEALDAFERCGSEKDAAISLGLPRTTFQNRLQAARGRYFLVPSEIASRRPAAKNEGEIDPQRLRGLLQSGNRLSLSDIAAEFKSTEGRALDACNDLRRQGLNVYQHDGLWSIERTPVPVEHSDELHVYRSDAEGVYRFGFVTDAHLCSKYARLDVLNELYDFFAAEGVTRVYNAGNWIDGESHFNKFDLLVHGMSAQMRYFAEHYPKREGITTYYIAGDDHEGWYAKKNGMDVGRHAEQIARDEFKRNDLRYLGYMESFVRLERAGSGEHAFLYVCHPGGGSAYAISYSPQKIIESLEGGEKPAVALFGHYHKMDVFNYRNVWIVQGGTTQDQTPFLRKMKIQAHVGGMLIELRQDLKGSITDCKPWMKRYFDRGYYNDQFNPAGPVKRIKA